MSILLFFENAVAAWTEPTVECNSSTEVIKPEFSIAAAPFEAKLLGGECAKLNGVWKVPVSNAKPGSVH